jgi:hypothetical protein
MVSNGWGQYKSTIESSSGVTGVEPGDISGLKSGASITNQGSGYTTAPTIPITGGGSPGQNQQHIFPSQVVKL